MISKTAIKQCFTFPSQKYEEKTCCFLTKDTFWLALYQFKISVPPQRLHNDFSPELRLYSNVFLLQVLKAPRDFVKSSILINRKATVVLVGFF